MSGIAAAQVQDTQARIIDAATERFRHFGYGKTTMAEIARDCGMSAGNLYRFFESKSDIGAAVGQSWFAAAQEVARRAVAERSAPAAARLESFTLAICRFTLEACRDKPRIQEMVDFICLERRDILDAHIAAMQAIVIEILEDGNASGELAVDDVETTAHTFRLACITFDYPPLLTMADEAVLEADARAVVRLLVSGMEPRNVATGLKSPSPKRGDGPTEPAR